MRKRRFVNDSKTIKYIDLSGGTIRKKENSFNVENVYNDNMDKFAKHEFMIIRGRFIDEGPEFASYRRIYESVFAKIRVNIKKLEAILKEHDVDFAKLDGKKLAYLSLKDSLRNLELVNCLIDN